MSYNVNPTGLFPGPDESGNTSASSHPYTYMDASATITLGASESGVYIPLANLNEHVTQALADESLATADYRYFIWALIDQCTEHQNVDELEDRPAGIQFVKGALFGEGDGITQIYKQKLFYSGAAENLNLVDVDEDLFG